MNNPLRILQTLDRHLAVPAEITLFGRAALALGYSASPVAFSATHDVDHQDDLADIEFLLTREPLTADELRGAFARARVPDVPEIQALFRAAQPRVLALVKFQAH